MLWRGSRSSHQKDLTCELLRQWQSNRVVQPSQDTANGRCFTVFILAQWDFDSKCLPARSRKGQEFSR